MAESQKGMRAAPWLSVEEFAKPDGLKDHIHRLRAQHVAVGGADKKDAVRFVETLEPAVVGMFTRMGIALDLPTQEKEMSDEAYAKECVAADEKVIDSVLVECAPASRGEMKTQFTKLRFKKRSDAPHQNLLVRAGIYGAEFEQEVRSFGQASDKTPTDAELVKAFINGFGFKMKKDLKEYGKGDLKQSRAPFTKWEQYAAEINRRAKTVMTGEYYRSLFQEDFKDSDPKSKGGNKKSDDDDRGRSRARNGKETKVPKAPPAARIPLAEAKARNACFQCGSTEHKIKDCPRAPKDAGPKDFKHLRPTSASPGPPSRVLPDRTDRGKSREKSTSWGKKTDGWSAAAVRKKSILKVSKRGRISDMSDDDDDDGEDTESSE